MLEKILILESWIKLLSINQIAGFLRCISQEQNDELKPDILYVDRNLGN